MPLSSSLWDTSPVEITSRIIKSSDPFTRYINNDLTPEEINQFGNEIWKIAFDIDYEGDLAQLPQTHLPTINKGLKHVKSRAMYHRLCKLKPSLANWDIVKDVFIDHSTFCNYYTIKCHCLMPRTICVMDKLIVYIPIFNGWTDELPEWWNESNPGGLFKIACKIGHFEMVQKLLFRRNEFDPKQENPLAIFGQRKEDALEIGFIMAAGCGYLDIVKFLLEMDNGVYYCCRSGASITVAARNGHLEVVAYLMDSYRETPGSVKSTFGIACEHGQTDVVRQLNTWVKVEGMTDREKTVNMKWAVESRNIDLVRYLFEKAGFNDAVSCGEAFTTAACIGFTAAVAMLVKVEGVDIAGGRELALRCRRTEILKMLSEVDVNAG
ncbi:hypothetical protein HDU76_002409 [Blyttiomyces sp. JEL0837]|nr:hypothetical protein HDU76_002409 [Blyttiomyces sp. JEL0837]